MSFYFVGSKIWKDVPSNRKSSSFQALKKLKFILSTKICLRFLLIKH